ncbi:complement decay-accelerating factor-like [Styela clava]
MMRLSIVFSLICCFVWQVFAQGVFSIEVDKECQYRQLVNGDITPTQISYGMDAVVQYACNEGYTLVGPTSSVCVIGIWTEDLPVCQGNLFN